MAKHIKVDGKFLQTHKTFSHLKESQRQKIYEWTRLATMKAIEQNVPYKKQKEYILDEVYEKIKTAEIWIPFGVVEKFYYSRNAKIRRNIAKKQEKENTSSSTE